MIQLGKPRYEFRVFGGDLQSFTKILSDSAEEEHVEFCADTYLVSRLTLDANVKIRDGKIEVKALQARRGLLEKWDVVAEHDLPVSGEYLRTRIFPQLGVEADLPDAAVLDLDGIGEIARLNPSLAMPELHKERTRYWFASAMAEYVRIGTDTSLVESIALESALPEAVEALIARFGLSRFQNQNYPAFLQQQLFENKPAA